MSIFRVGTGSEAELCPSGADKGRQTPTPVFGRWRRALRLGVVASLVACGSPKPPTAPKEQTTPTAPTPVPPKGPEPSPLPPPGELPKLHTGSIEPKLSAGLEGKLTGYFADQYGELFEVSIPEPPVYPNELDTVFVQFGQEPAQPISLLEVLPRSLSQRQPNGEARATLWLRRRRPSGSRNAETDLSAAILTAARGRTPGLKIPVKVPLRTKPKSSKAVQKKFFIALSSYLADTPLGALLASREQSSDSLARYQADWQQLLSLSSGYDSVEAALHANRSLRLTSDPKRAKIDIKTLNAPRIQSHPWRRMLAQLGTGNQQRLLDSEPLANLTPADFYYLRAASYEILQALMDESDRWLTPALRTFSSHQRRLNLQKRYRLQLGLPESELSRLVGPKVVSELALVGSDPFVKQGSDVTLLVRPKAETAFRNALNLKRAELGSRYPLTTTSRMYKGIEIKLHSSAAGAVRQHVAALPKSSAYPQGVVLISNSGKAIEHILDVALSQAPSLLAEPDFQYMLMRDADVPSPMLGYLGERFVMKAVAPQQRILDARRQLARAELTRVSLSALLYGWVEGHAPQTTRQIERAAWAPKQLLKHVSGAKIEFTPGGAPHSSWGTPSFLTPLIELAEVTKVTKEEADAYRQFVRRYQQQWSEFIDPIALRVNVASSQVNKTTLSAELRVLPIMQHTDYRELQRYAGSTHVSAKPPLPGLQMLLGLGKDSPLRQMASGEGRNFLGRKFGLDWLGDWISAGVYDDPALARVVQLSGSAPEPPSQRESVRELELIQRLPGYLIVDIKSKAQAAIALTLIRQAAMEAVSERNLSWQEIGEYHTAPIFEVKFDDIALYYSLTEKRIFVSLSENVLKALIAADKAMPEPAVSRGASAQRGGQWLTNIQTQKPSGLLTALAWLIEEEQRPSPYYKNWDALALHFGVPELSGSPDKLQQVAQAYLGYVPVTPDGKLHVITAEGLTDPERGSAHRPVWGKVPVSGSPLQALLSALGEVSMELAFDEEPNSPEQRSLRTNIVIQRSR